MASGFELYVQTELPKRPYLQNDVPANSVIIRSGNGPRELSAIAIPEGKTLANVGGTLQAVTLPIVFDHTQNTSSAEWIINHNMGTTKFVAQCFYNGKMMVPDEIEIVDNNSISIQFSSPTIGTANIVFWL